jgi:hypothetical protein
MGNGLKHNGSLTFLRAELQTGLIFTSLAEQASDEDTINRNRQNARKACRSVRHFIGRITIPEDENKELHDQLEELEGRLRILEEAVE